MVRRVLEGSWSQGPAPRFGGARANRRRDPFHAAPIVPTARVHSGCRRAVDRHGAIRRRTASRERPVSIPRPCGRRVRAGQSGSRPRSGRRPRLAREGRTACRLRRHTAECTARCAGGAGRARLPSSNGASSSWRSGASRIRHAHPTSRNSRSINATSTRFASAGPATVA